MEITGTLGQHTLKLEANDFQAAVARGRVFSVANQTGVVTQDGLSVTEPVLTLANPAGSGVKGRLWFAGTSFLVAFPLGAVILLAAGTDASDDAVTGTKVTAHRRGRLGGLSDQGNIIQPFLAATLPAIPVGIAILGCGLTGTIGTAPTAPMLGRWFNGAIEIMPGTNISIQTTTDSGAVGTVCEYIWEEIDL